MAPTQGERLATIDEKLGNMTLMNQEILANVKKTNGRVNNLEDWKIRHEAEMDIIKRSIKFIIIPIIVTTCGGLCLAGLRYWFGI